MKQFNMEDLPTKPKEMKIKEDVERTLRNFARVPSWNTTMNKEAVNQLLKYSDTIFCNGMLRQIKIDVITDDFFKVYTTPI